MPFLIYNFVHLPTAQNTNIYLTKSFFKIKSCYNYLFVFQTISDHDYQQNMPRKLTSHSN